MPVRVVLTDLFLRTDWKWWCVCLYTALTCWSCLFLDSVAFTHLGYNSFSVYFFFPVCCFVLFCFIIAFGFFNAVPVADIKAVVTGKDCPHMKEKGALKQNKVCFSNSYKCIPWNTKLVNLTFPKLIQIFFIPACHLSVYTNTLCFHFSPSELNY